MFISKLQKVYTFQSLKTVNIKTFWWWLTIFFMKNKFKFFNGISPIEIDPNDGVTDEYLINLNREVWLLSDWITSTQLHNDIESEIDCLYIDFKDIDGTEYTCTIFEDRTFEVIEIIKLENGNIELIENTNMSNEILSNSDYLLSYFMNMPRTIRSVF